MSASQKTGVANINNISYTLDGFGIDFGFTYKGDGFKSAYLQLPNTPDSQHTIDGEDFDCDNEYHNEVYDALKDYFYSDFKDNVCAKARVILGKKVIHVEEIDFEKTWFDLEDDVERKSNIKLYVTFDEQGISDLLKEGSASDYYNVFYFDKVDDLSDEEEEQAIKIAKSAFFSDLKTELDKKLQEVSNNENNDCDYIVGEFMRDEFGSEWEENDCASEFYENVSCDCRINREYEIAE